MEFVTRNFKFHFDVNSPKYIPKPKGDFNRMKARPLICSIDGPSNNRSIEINTCRKIIKHLFIDLCFRQNQNSRIHIHNGAGIIKWGGDYKVVQYS